MDKGAISRDDVLRTLREYDELGGPAFLERYGFKAARKYFVLHEGKEYDSKAVAAVAHRYRHGRPLTAKELSGGIGHAVDWLRREGFLVGAAGGAGWTRDELILACDAVVRNGWRGLAEADPRVGELSGLLQFLSAMPLREDTAAKTFHLARLHPDHTPTEAAGLDREVTRDFLARPVEMALAAELLRAGLLSGDLHPSPAEDDTLDDETGAPEGRILYRRHLTRERNKKLRARKIAAVLRKSGTLSCEACEFDFEAFYGERGRGYIECHHVVPLHEAGEGTTKLTDLALICSNCHRMIHRSAPWLTPAELGALVRAQARAKRRPFISEAVAGIEPT
ncbi:HNH endonuclease [Streptomyces acidiscabies]|uniref:HNH endonuclease n=1 Tax=Streptomyces acidiscabies TaxID=42234 RepID=UPI00067DD082|nr:HNH endonuclease [Streptomyces acidiscabies]